jgi:hypothetical protein
MGDYKNSDTAFKNYENIMLHYATKLIAFWIRRLQGDLHPCADGNMSPTPAVTEKKNLL